MSNLDDDLNQVWASQAARHRERERIRQAKLRTKAWSQVTIQLWLVGSVLWLASVLWSSIPGLYSAAHFVQMATIAGWAVVLGCWIDEIDRRTLVRFWRDARLLWHRDR